ncbi:MAG: ABC-F family ATP-binding cassette domain-containing protein [Gammaproteobacteria bacterium]|nr:ABC-F family ATP-binding cassette domain-containing protein [Gammaproteobacteria bacterium]
MANILCRKVSFGYDGTERNVFTDLDLVIDTGWRTALTGRNGRGKTTLLRLIQGELVPDRGSIERPVDVQGFPVSIADATISAFDAAKDAAGPFRRWEREMARLLDTGDEVSLARYGTLQTRFQEAGGYEMDANLERELAALGIDSALRSRRFDRLSGGERTRCLLAGLFARQAGFPLIDEPTNHLDRAGREHVAEYLHAKPGFLIVSHDRAFLDGCVDHVIALNPDTVETRRCSFSTWRQAFLERLARQEGANTELRREIGRLEDAAGQRRRGAEKREAEKGAHTDKGFIGARAARQMKRAIAVEHRAEKAVEERRQTLVDIERTYPLRLPGPSRHRARPLVTAHDLVVVRDKPLFAPISFRVRSGDRLAVVGPNGSGKTSLLEVLRQAPLAFEGTFTRPARLDIARVSQQPRWTTGFLSDHCAAGGIDESRFRQVTAALGVRGDTLERRLESMSPGQRKKIELARSFLSPADLLLWDEPLNFLDIDAREAIQEVVLQDTPTMVFVEHDAVFVDLVATATLELRPPEDVN